MKPNYKTFTEFKQDLNNESSTQEILYLLGIVPDNEIKMIRSPFRKNGRERTPSLQLAGAGEGIWFRDYGGSCYKGDVFTFLQLYYKCTFYEAVLKVTDLYSVTLSDNGFESIKNLSKTQKKLKAEWEQYQKDYLAARSIPEVVAQAKRLFPAEIGYSKNEKRIVVPFFDKAGNVVRFSKRAIFPDQKPKWVHSKNDLTSMVYGYYNYQAFANENIDFMIIVEGPGDAIGVQRAGYANVVAQCGVSSFSKAQVEALEINGVDSVCFLYDPDDAGRNGTLRAALVLCRNNPIIAMNSYVAFLPGPNDAGDAPPEEIRQAIDSKISVLDYIIDNASINDLKKAYLDTPEYLRASVWDEVLNYYAKRKKVTYAAVVQMLTKNRVKKKTQMSERECRLLATAMVEGYEKYEPFTNKTVEQAKKELKMRYKMEV